MSAYGGQTSQAAARRGKPGGQAAHGNLLATIPKRSTTILATSRNRPWTRDGFSTAFNRAKIAADLSDRDLHFHDLRGTAATRFYVAGLPERVITEIMAWDEEHVTKIIRRYVGRAAATKAIIHQLNQAEKRTADAEPTTKSTG
jgi:integrase